MPFAAQPARPGALRASPLYRHNVPLQHRVVLVITRTKSSNSLVSASESGRRDHRNLLVGKFVEDLRNLSGARWLQVRPYKIDIPLDLSILSLSVIGLSRCV